MCKLIIPDEESVISVTVKNRYNFLKLLTIQSLPSSISQFYPIMQIKHQTKTLYPQSKVKLKKFALCKTTVSNTTTHRSDTTTKPMVWIFLVHTKEVASKHSPPSPLRW
jgi:hypothetical protein